MIKVDQRNSWTTVVYHNDCNVQYNNIGIKPGLNVMYTGQASCNTSAEMIIESKLIVFPDPRVITSEVLNVSCFTYSTLTEERINSQYKIVKFSSKLIHTELCNYSVYIH